MPITVLDEQRFETSLRDLTRENVNIAQWAEHSFSDDEFLLLFLKTVTLLLPNNSQMLRDWDDRAILENKGMAKQFLREVLVQAIRVARTATGEQSDIAKEYSTGELAKFFEVSTTTINNWIKEGRFEGVERPGPHKQVRVSEHTWFVSPSGARYQVKDVIKAWEKDNMEWQSRKEVSEDELVASYLRHFEGKYGGSYEATLGSKTWDELSDEEETDASMWTYFLNRRSSKDDARDS